jgi:small-conductance mechanosensitive channel
MIAAAWGGGRRGLALFLCSLVVCIALLPRGTAAQTPHAAPAAPAIAAPAPASPSIEDLQDLVATLKDDAARAKLVAQLQALIAAQRGIEPEKPAPPPLFGRLSQQIEAFTGEILAGAAVVVDAPRLFAWLRSQAVHPENRERWVQAGVALILVFGLAALAEVLVRRILSRLLPKMPPRRSDTVPVRVLFAALNLLFDALPVVVFAGVAYAVIALTLDPFGPTRITLSVLADATVETRLLFCLARALLLPIDGGTLVVPIDAETRNYLYIWVQRLLAAGLYGYAIPEAAWWLGVPGALYALMLNLAGLVLAVLAIVFLLQNRTTIAHWISGGADGAPSGWSRVRGTFGEIWHLLVILYIVGIYLIYALRIEGGFAYVLRATVASLVIIVVAQLLVRSAQGLSRRGFAIAPDLKARYPTLEHRANRYVPALSVVLSLAIYAAAVFCLLQAWNVPAFSWLGSEVGRRIASRAAAIAAVVVAAFAAWEFFASAIERRLQKIDGDGAQRRTRLRTLLPLLRTALLCLIFLMAVLIILSEIGIDIAPLLAGAGVVGLAIGIGSQALVKDIITGLFILVEDQLAVGDVVDLGRDHAGVVEGISVRTIRLRDLSGVVHTVPFSEVTSVRNLTKDFANVVARITISYREDIDRVVAILRSVTDQLMQDEELRPLILDPFDYLGVDALNELWVVLLLRIRTLPMQQWKVGRAFNRLVKIAFDEHGIAMRDPSPVAITGLAASAGAAAEEAREGQPA